MNERVAGEGSALSLSLARASIALGPSLSGWPRRGEIDLRSLGKIGITVQGFARAPAAPRGDVAFTLWRGEEQGRVFVDGWLALAIASRVLGGRLPSVVRPLGSFERGVCAAVLIDLVRRASSHLSVDLEPPASEPATPRDPPLAIVLAIDAAGVAGSAHLVVPASWLVGSGGIAAGRSVSLSVEVALEIATTALAASDIGRAVHGDAVVFDQPACPAGGRIETCRIRVGRFFAPASRGTSGTFQLEGPFQEAPDAASLPSIMPSEVSPTAVLAAAPIEVTAELGRTVLRGDEVLGLVPGSVIAFEGDGAIVELRAAGRLWARGEIVDVEGRFGVRIVELTLQP